MTDPLTLSFTAARNLGWMGQEVIVNVLTVLPSAERYVTGAAEGGDAFTGAWLYWNRRDAEHVVVLPADRSRVAWWWLDLEAVTVVEMPTGSTYADRNLELVTRGTAVCGFPSYPEDDPRSRRSGTWQTIRMSRRAGKLHRWDCVQPPYRGQVEAFLRDISATQESETAP